MFLLTKPTESQIRDFLDSAEELRLSYVEVGATRGTPPIGYTVDHNRIKLGHGGEVFEHAGAALKSWKHFDLGWVKLVPEDAAVTPGSVLAVLVAHLSLWSLNACRVIYLIDDQDRPVKRFGFAYGTLTEHAERGEERFMIEWNAIDDSVWYDILAFSRPEHWLAKIGYPLTRWWQKRFAHDSLRAMVKYTADEKRLTVAP